MQAGRPLHGANLFPADPAALGPAVLDWMGAITQVGTVLLGAIAVGLGLDDAWFERSVSAEPTVLFRIFRYPARMATGWVSPNTPTTGADDPRHRRP